MVKFRKSFRNYQPGEIAGFSKQHEAWLVNCNIAEKFAVKEAKNEQANEAGAKPAAPSKDKANDGRPTA